MCSVSPASAQQVYRNSAGKDNGRRHWGRDISSALPMARLPGPSACPDWAGQGVRDGCGVLLAAAYPMEQVPSTNNELEINSNFWLWQDKLSLGCSTLQPLLLPALDLLLLFLQQLLAWCLQNDVLVRYSNLKALFTSSASNTFGAQEH